MPSPRTLTRMQAAAYGRYAYGHVTQEDLGPELGIKQPAVSRRLARARERMGQSPRRSKALRRVTVPVGSLSDARYD